uniref:G-protein coupled receptors family 1 profile domain-containing protein n=1 Tax=Ascaris lumbricoides TaxID=6252 RepID=A0A0M3IJE0_ASCLU
MSSIDESFLERITNGTLAEIIIGSTYVALSTAFMVSTAMVDWVNWHCNIDLMHNLQIAGGILNSSWITMSGLIFALALNQLMVVSNGISKLQNNCLLRFTLATTVHICAAYSVGIMFFLAFMTPWSGVIYLREAFCFTYAEDLEANEMISQIDWVYTIIIISLSFFIYVLIFILVLRKDDIDKAIND